MGIGPIEIAVFFLVLGVLVFVHEMGHFLAAKACGIYVDRFSLGMPPRLFGFRYGETDYCIGLLPIGGYVKMAGQEDQPLSDEERDKTYGHVPPARWYNNKPVWQRAIVLVAGPAMNLVLAIVIYASMAGFGREVSQTEMETRIGDVEVGSPASAAPLYPAQAGAAPDFTAAPAATGWHTSDRIVSIDGKPMNMFEDIMVAAILGSANQSVVEIERPLPGGGTSRYFSPITAQIFGEEKESRRFGIAPYIVALVRNVFPESPALKGGVRPGDVILTANGQPVDQPTFTMMVRKLAPGAPLALTIERDSKVILLNVETRREGSFKDLMFNPGLNAAFALPDGEPLEVFETDRRVLESLGLRTGDRVLTAEGSTQIGATLRRMAADDPAQFVQVTVERPGGILSASTTWNLKLTAGEVLRAVTGIDPNAMPQIAMITPELAEKTGLQRKDRIVEIAGAPATVAGMRKLEQTRIGETVPVVVERPAILLGVYQKKKILRTELTIDPIQQIGVAFGMKTVVRRETPANILPYAFKETLRQATRIGAVLHRLFTGGLSPKQLGGPVMIGDIVTTAYQIGFSYLLDITAMISVNLAIFNLLPMPVLDGGQLMFLGIEAIRRRPVSTRVMELVQQVGFVFIIGLLLFVTFNDVSRIVQRLLP
jgi:regulator of sigma E protease